MADALEVWQADPDRADQPLSECLSYLIDAQIQSRCQGRAEGSFRQARLATHYSAHTFRASPASGLTAQRLDHLRGLSWIRRGQTVVITGETHSGKTHLAAGLGQEAMVDGIRTLFVQTPTMLDQCIEHDERKAERRRHFKKLCMVPLLILDDFATEHADTEMTYLLRRLFDERSRRRLPTIAASINAIEDWDGYFADEAAREGIYSRLLGGECHRVALKRTAGTARARQTSKAPRAA
jgi:DNA replication protein DnaC